MISYTMFTTVNYIHTTISTRLQLATKSIKETYGIVNNFLRQLLSDNTLTAKVTC